MQAQVVPHEQAYLCPAATHPRQLFDAVTGLADRTRRPFTERRFHRLAVRSQAVRPPFLTEIAYGFQATHLKNRQDFSHREADAKSLLDEAVRRGREERRGQAGRMSTKGAVGANEAAESRGNFWL